MKKISILKTFRIILVVMFAIQLVRLFYENHFGESEVIMFRLINTILLVLALIVVFGFGKKLEQEKIEKEERRSEARKKIL